MIGCPFGGIFGHLYHDFTLPLLFCHQGVRPTAEAERPGSSGKDFYCKCKCNSIYLNIREFLFIRVFPFLSFVLFFVMIPAHFYPSVVFETM